MSSSATTSLQKRNRRHARVRARIAGTADRPRLAVFKSNRHIYAQLIDDMRAHTLASASTLHKNINGSGRSAAQEIGAAIAAAAKEQGITAVVFDRGGFRYAGIVAEIADNARQGGLTL